MDLLICHYDDNSGPTYRLLISTTWHEFYKTGISIAILIMISAHLIKREYTIGNH